MHLGELGSQFADLREDGQRGARRETGARGGERRHLELLPRVRAQVLWNRRSGASGQLRWAWGSECLMGIHVSRVGGAGLHVELAQRGAGVRHVDGEARVA